MGDSRARQTDPESSRKSRSKATADAILDAAFDLIAEGYGLDRLGLTREEVCRRSGQLTGTFDYHFGPKTRRNLYRELVDRLRDRLVEAARGSTKLYEFSFDRLERLSQKGALRILVGEAILRDARAFGPDNVHRSAVARERLFYLLIALCGLPPEKTGGINYQERLREAHEARQAVYGGLYDQFCRVLGREYVAGRDRTRRALNAYLEGVMVHRRFGAGPSDDEVVDTVLRLFLVTTKPKGGDDVDVDEWGLPGSKVQPEPLGDSK
jgi:AcrR family transcriptional regulator